ncbi:MAG: hypothetical protein H6662_08155 [Ardenticatenaceae bacterium]|nr:hypothetical protein [Anaerolineales bacterium]MCB8921538.1 hypothetical protein [Ardenticatenaceae bacterium]MCB8990943.1 hypothetical protein [Ardenticatenaceae bacterium]MCB9004406.1 hypothetical protein [Ardenticatenaceae bacterium]
MSDEIPIKIIIPPEEDDTAVPIIEEPPLVPERTPLSAKTKRAAGKMGKLTFKTAKKAWNTEARRKVTRGLRKGTTAVAAKGAEVVGKQVRKTAEKQAKERAAAVQTRLRETDWKAEAQTGMAKGLRWLSERLAALANRMKSEK